jgi:hypothetical protein
MADLTILHQQQSALLACEALGFLHNIGKLDDRFSKNDFLYKRIADPVGIVLTEEKREIQAPCSSPGKNSLEPDELAALAHALGANEKATAEHLLTYKTARTQKEEWAKKTPRKAYLAHKLKLPELLSGANIIPLLRSQGVDLSEQEISTFIAAYINWRGANPATELDSGLPVLTERYPYSLLLNLFWDDFHWRPQEPGNKRRDNLSFWLADGQDGFNRFLRVMAICHEAISRGDKGSDEPGPAVGNRTNILGSEEAEQRRLPLDEIKKKLAPSEMTDILDCFRHVASDGRLPLNDVALYDYCDNFGGFLKTALAKFLLDGKLPGEDDIHLLKWRLLWFRYDGLAWIGKGGRLADAVARSRVWDKVMDAIQDYLEVKLPVAKAIYRDTNGMFFLAPDVEDLCALEVKTGCSLAKKISQIAVEKSAGEIAVRPQLSEPMFGYEIRIAGWMGRTSPVPADAAEIAKAWQEAGEVCTVCTLRPIAGKDEKGGIPNRQRVCLVCHERRTGRAGEWIKKGMLGSIWMSELADRNGRCALISGRLEISRWLDGELFQSLEQKWMAGDDQISSPGASFTRTRGIWQLSEHFWQQTAEKLAQGALSPRPGRWRLAVTDNDSKLAVNHAYELDTAKGRLQVVCTGKEKGGAAASLVVVDWRAPRAADQTVWKKLLPVPVRLFLRGGYGGADQELGDFALTDDGVRFDETPFSPSIHIVADPLRFLALVPADQAMTAAEQIDGRYRELFNRVQDRLPLRIGIVYFPEKTPLFTALDAGVKMVSEERQWVEQRIEAMTITDGQHQVCLEDGQRFCYQQIICQRDDIWYVRPKQGCGYLPLSPSPAEGAAFAYLPSTLDLAFLGETSRRHRLHDSTIGRQDLDFGPMPLRPEASGAFSAIWKIMKRLSRSQLSRLESLHVYALAEMDGVDAEARNHFLLNGVKTAGAGWWGKISQKEQEILTKAVDTGLLWTVLTYNLHLLKKKPAGEPRMEEQE